MGGLQGAILSATVSILVVPLTSENLQSYTLSLSTDINWDKLDMETKAF